MRTAEVRQTLRPADTPRMQPVTRSGSARVLHVALSLSHGGTERLVIEIAKRLHPDVPTAVCCLDEPGAWASELTDIGIDVTALRRRPGFHPWLGYRVAALAARHRATVLHCHHYSSFVYGTIAVLLRPRIRLVFTEHGRLADAPPSLKRRLVNPWIGRLPGRLFAVSSDLRRHMIAEGFPEHRVQVLHNGIDVGIRHVAARREVRRSLGIPPDAFVVGTVARLDPVKDLETLLRACATARRRIPQAALMIVGDGTERVKLERTAAQLGLADSVYFIGNHSDVRATLPALDVYVNTSVHEGISLTILEAMAVGLPVVATRVGGTPEVVIDGETGLLVPPSEPVAVARAISRLAHAPSQRAAMGAAGRFRVRTSFAIGRMVERYYQAYLGRDD